MSVPCGQIWAVLQSLSSLELHLTQHHEYNDSETSCPVSVQLMMMIAVVCLEIWKINNLFQTCEIFRQPEHKSSQSVYFLSWKLILSWQGKRGKSSNDNIPCSVMAKISLFSSDKNPVMVLPSSSTLWIMNIFIALQDRQTSLLTVMMIIPTMFLFKKTSRLTSLSSSA